MSNVEPRIATASFQCPWGCRTTVPAGEAIWPLKSGTTESSACGDCAWRHENGYPLWRGDEAP